MTVLLRRMRNAMCVRQKAKANVLQDMRRLLCKWITGLLPIVKVHDDRRRSREPKSFE